MQSTKEALPLLTGNSLLDYSMLLSLLEFYAESQYPKTLIEQYYRHSARLQERSELQHEASINIERKVSTTFFHC